MRPPLETSFSPDRQFVRTWYCDRTCDAKLKGLTATRSEFTGFREGTVNLQAWCLVAEKLPFRQFARVRRNGNDPIGSVLDHLRQESNKDAKGDNEDHQRQD